MDNIIKRLQVLDDWFGLDNFYVITIDPDTKRIQMQCVYNKNILDAIDRWNALDENSEESKFIAGELSNDDYFIEYGIISFAERKKQIFRQYLVKIVMEKPE